MENLNNLCQWLTGEGVLLFDRRLDFSNSETKAAAVRLEPDGAVGIFLDRSRMANGAEEKSCLLHEAGHYATGTTHRLYSPYELVERHEYRANKWAVQRALSAEELDEAVAEGHTELWDLAEYFGVTEELMRQAVCWYTYGNLAAALYF